MHGSHTTHLVLVVDGSNLIGTNNLELVNELLGGRLDDWAVVNNVLDRVDPAVAISLSFGGEVVGLAA